MRLDESQQTNGAEAPPTSTSHGESNEVEESRSPKWRLWQPVRWWNNRRADAALARDREYWRPRDRERNAASKPPPDESCQLVAIWVAELYTPSTLIGLTDGLRRKGWDDIRRGDLDIVDWILQSRVGGGGSWSRLGLVRRRGVGFADLRDDLPPGVDAINLGLFALTPSITVITAAFVLGDEAAVGYHTTLDADYETTLLPLHRDRGRRLAQLGWRIRYGPGWMWRRGHVIEDPELARRRAAHSYLVKHKERAEEWLMERFPGVFAAGLLGGHFPAAALTVLEVAEPFAERGPGWQRAAGLDSWWRVWRSDEWPGCLLSLPGGGIGDVPHLMRLAVKRSHTEDWNLDGPENWYVSLRADDLLAGLLARWAILTASYGQREVLARLRDVTARKRGHRVVQELKTLRRAASTSALDAELLAREGARLADDKARMRFHTVAFTREDEHGGKVEKAELLDLMGTNLRRHADDVGAANRLLLDTTALVASLTAAISNVRLQRIVTSVSIVSLIVATIAVIVAVLSGSG